MESERDRLRANLDRVLERIERACAKAGRHRESVRLVVVTKTCPVETIQMLIDLGIRDIGENRVQEIVAKQPRLTGDFSLHLIGHLQTNKVALVLPHIGYIQSIDRERLISRVELHGKTPPKLRALVEVNTSGEASKTGCPPNECRALCERVVASSSLELHGLMTIGPLAGDERRIRESFTLLRNLGESCSDLSPHHELSMGMSGDFELAIEEGSTMVRIGTSIVGERQP